MANQFLQQAARPHCQVMPDIVFLVLAVVLVKLSTLHFDDCLRPRPQLDLIQADAEEFAPFVDRDRQTPAVLLKGV